MPSPSGRPRSRRMMSGFRPAACARPSRALVASTRRDDSFSNAARKKRRICGSSSMSSTTGAGSGTPRSYAAPTSRGTWEMKMCAQIAGVLLMVIACTGSALLAGQTPADSGRTWWLSGQFNGIYQWHPSFRAAYTGTNSLRPVREASTSRLVTVYAGLRLGAHTELLLDLESAGGGGISKALGFAGFTNLDVVRNPTLGSAPYVARGLIRYTVALGVQSERGARGPLTLLPILPVRRLSIAVGKLSMADFFDLNTAGSDSHLQFMNWTADNNGAYDYAADTRGYTIGAVAEYRDRDWAVRWGEAVMPTVANGSDYDWRL